MTSSPPIAQKRPAKVMSMAMRTPARAGPMTRAMLLRNAVQAARYQESVQTLLSEVTRDAI